MAWGGVDDVIHASARRYAWLSRFDDEGGSSEALCLTGVTGMMPADVLSIFGADPDALPMPLGSVSSDLVTAIAVFDSPPGLAVVEYHGRAGAMPAVMCRVSARGRAAGLYWNAELDNLVTLADHGRILCCFKPFGFDPRTGERWGEDPSVLVLADGLNFHLDWMASALALIERFTSVRFKRGMLKDMRAGSPIMRATTEPGEE